MLCPNFAKQNKIGQRRIQEVKKKKKKYEQYKYNRLIEWLAPQLPYHYKIVSITPYKENPDFLLITFSPNISRDDQPQQTDNYDDYDNYAEEESNIELLIKPTDYAEQKN